MKGHECLLKVNFEEVEASLSITVRRLKAYLVAKTF